MSTLLGTTAVSQLREYQHIRTAQFLSWSADGKSMLVQTRFGNAAQLHRVYEPHDVDTRLG